MLLFLYFPLFCFFSFFFFSKQTSKHLPALIGLVDEGRTAIYHFFFYLLFVFRLSLSRIAYTSLRHIIITAFCR